MTWIWKTWSQIDPSEQNETLDFVVASLEAVVAISTIPYFSQGVQQEDCPSTVEPSPRCYRVACTGVTTTESSWKLKRNTEGNSAKWLLVITAHLQLTKVWSLLQYLEPILWIAFKILNFFICFWLSCCFKLTHGIWCTMIRTKWDLNWPLLFWGSCVFHAMVTDAHNRLWWDSHVLSEIVKSWEKGMY